MIARDARFALRSLARDAGLSVTAVVVLALGISLTTTVFAMVNGVVLSKLPFADADRLVSLDTARPSAGIDSLAVSLAQYRTWKDNQRSFARLGAFFSTRLNLSGNEQPERFRGAYVSADALAMTGVIPAKGRLFTAEDERPGAPRVVLLGYNLWQRRYGGDPAIVDQTVRVEGEPAAVIGVLPAGYLFPVHEELWVPLRLDPAELPVGERTPLTPVALLRPAVSRAQAQAEMDSLLDKSADPSVIAVVQPYTRRFIGEGDRALQFTMLAVVSFVLVIACFNVANLLLARALNRSKEIAVRSALGARRGRLLRETLIQSLVLALPGAALGVLLTMASLKVLSAMTADPDRPFWVSIRLDGTVLLFAAAVATAAGVLAGLIPGLQASRADLRSVLNDAARGASSFRLSRLSKVIVVVEIALSYALLVGTAMVVKTVTDLTTKRFNFATEEVLTARVELFRGRYAEDAARVALFERLTEQLRALPGVAAAAATSDIPTQESGSDLYTVEGRTYPAENVRPFAHTVVVSPGYFDAYRVPLVDGKDFSSFDREGSPPVLLVNQSFAQREWPGESPLGKRLRFGEGPWVTVIGLCPDIQFGEFFNEEPAGVYLPLAQNSRRSMALVVRAASSSASLAPLVRAELARLDPDLSLDRVATMEQIIAANHRLPRLLSSLFAVFGAVALLLALVGLYGLISFSVKRRTAELGVRMALGGQRRQILTMVIRQALRQVAWGLALGFLLSLAVAKMVSDVFGVDMAGVLLFTGLAVLLVVIGLLASLLPARRATLVNPVVALKSE